MNSNCIYIVNIFILRESHDKLDAQNSRMQRSIRKKTAGGMCIDIYTVEVRLFYYAKSNRDT